MAWKGTPHSPKLQHCWNLTIRLFSVISRTLVRGGAYPPAEKQSVYSTAPVDRANFHWLQPRPPDDFKSSSKTFLIQIGKCYHYPGPQFIFGVAWSFIGLKYNCAQIIIIKRIKIGGVQGDEIAEIFWHQTLSSPACVAQLRLLLPKVGSPICHLLDPGKHYLKYLI